NAPTPGMLNLYKVIVLLTGDLNYYLLGPFKDRSANDVGILEDWLKGSSPVARRGLLCGGDGFVEDAHTLRVGSSQQLFVSTCLGAVLDPTSGSIGYRRGSSNQTSVVDVIPQVPDLGAPNATYGIRNRCYTTNDVLAVVNGTQTPNAVAAADYQNFGANG